MFLEYYLTEDEDNNQKQYEFDWLDYDPYGEHFVCYVYTWLSDDVSASFKAVYQEEYEDWDIICVNEDLDEEYTDEIACGMWGISSAELLNLKTQAKKCAQEFYEENYPEEDDEDYDYSPYGDDGPFDPAYGF